MSGANGPALTISWDGATLVGVRSKGYTATAEYVDVTTDDDDGWRTLLTNPSVRGVDATVSGISSDQVLLAALMASSITGETLSFGLPTTTGTVAGTFVINSFEQTGEYDGAVEFTAAFMSTGVVTYTAGS